VIKIFAIHFNRPDFILLQNKTLRKFVKEDFEYVVVNNASQPEIRNVLEQAAKSISIRTIQVFENIDQHAAAAYPGYHHSIAMNQILRDEIKNQNDICVILDGDMFLLKPYSFEEKMKGVQLLGGLLQQKGRYWLTPVAIGMKPFELPDFDSINLIGSHIFNMEPHDKSKDVSFYPRKVGDNYVFDCPACTGAVSCSDENHIRLDTGGEIYTYLRDHPDVKVKRMSTTSQIKNDSIHKFPELTKHGYTEEYHFEIYDGSFLHYCRSSNWDRKNFDFHQRKTRVLVDIAESVMRGETSLDSDYTLDDNEWSGWPLEVMKTHGVI